MPGETAQAQTTDLDQVLAASREEMIIDEERLKSFNQEESAKPEVLEEGAAKPDGKPETDETAGAAKETEKKRDAADAGTPPGDKPPETPPAQEKKYRFKDQDEAEKAYVELQRNLSKQGEKLKEFEAKTRDAEDEKAWSEKVKQADTNYRTYLSERMGRTADAIDALDEEDPDYSKKVAGIRADEQADIRDYERAHPELFGRAVMSRKEEAPAHRETKESAEDQGTPVVDPKQYVVEQAQHHEIDPQDPFFIAFCSTTPTERDGKPIPFEEQVELAITSTKNYYASRDGTPKPQAEQTPAQTPPPSPVKSEQPLGKGAGGTPFPGGVKPETTGPLSIDGALERVRAERTL